jgi:hypothetical protein
VRSIFDTPLGSKKMGEGVSVLIIQATEFFVPGFIDLTGKAAAQDFILGYRKRPSSAALRMTLSICFREFRKSLGAGFEKPPSKCKATRRPSAMIDIDGRVEFILGEMDNDSLIKRLG